MNELNPTCEPPQNAKCIASLFDFGGILRRHLVGNSGFHVSFTAETFQ